MYVTPVACDVGVVYSWGRMPFPAEKRLAGGDYYMSAEESLAEAPAKLELEFASLLNSQVDIFKDAMAKEWEPVGWYPSIHQPYPSSYAVHIFMRKSQLPLYGTFNSPTGIMLGCSVGFFQGTETIRPSLATDYRFGTFKSLPGQRRQTIFRWLLSQGESPADKFAEHGYRKVATTTMAEYWYFGLKPGESR